mgnify:CR=1 FL=1
MVGNNPIDYYDENYVSFPSTEYIEEILNMVERQKKFFEEVYTEIFLSYDQNPEFTNANYKVKIPEKNTILVTNYCFCTLLFLLLVTTLFSTICFSVCFRNKKKIKVVKVEPFDLENAEPKIIKAEPLELKINKT